MANKHSLILPNKKVLITGASGQDGYYLSLLLEQKGYFVIKTDTKELDITDFEKVKKLLSEEKPDEIYNLAGRTHIMESFKNPTETVKVNSLGAINLLDSFYKINPKGKFFQASSCAIFDANSPYALSKLLAHEMVKMYRNKYGMFAVNGILYNHESPLRNFNFVTQKVTLAAACAKLKIKNSVELNEEGEPIIKDGKVSLGNLETKRDWGFAGDYVEGIYMMMQSKKPDDFSFSTGEIHTVHELCEEAFNYVNLNWEDYVAIDKRFERQNEKQLQVENSRKTKEILGWEPKTKFKELVKMMVDAHLVRLK